MPPKNSRKKEPPKESRIPSKFKQDIAGILLIAVAVFIFISNLSSSTGLLGLFVIKKALRSVIGVGIYLLPFFIGIYGVIMLIRQEVKELTVRLFGLLVMFLVFITVAQFAAPDYFASITRYPLAGGAGGAIGYAVKFSLEKTIGLAGSYVILCAFAFIATLLIFNVTVQTLLNLIAGLLKFEKPTAEKTSTSSVESPKKAVVTQMPLVKGFPPIQKEVIPAPPLPPEPKPKVEFKTR